MFGQSNDEARNIKNEFNQNISTDYTLSNGSKQKQSVVLDGDLASWIHRQNDIAKQTGESVIITSIYALMGQAVHGFMTLLDIPAIGYMLTTATSATLIFSVVVSVVIVGSLVFCLASTGGNRFNASCRLALMVLGFSAGFF